MCVRFTLLAMSVAALATAAAAQTGEYYAERGHWIVATSSGGTCRAGNRPPQEFNHAPYNALQFVVRPGNRIGDRVERISTIIDVKAKMGRSGELVFG